MVMSSLCWGSSYSVEVGAGVGVGEGVGVGVGFVVGFGFGIGLGVLVGLGFLEVGFALAFISSSRLYQLTQPEGVPIENWSLCFGGVGFGGGVGVGFGLDEEDFFDLVFV